MQKSPVNNRCVRLTDAGVDRLQSVRRQFRSTVEDIVVDPATPSVNTVKRALRRQPIFVSTLDRIWDYFQRRALESGDRLPYLAEDVDFVYDDGEESGEGNRTSLPPPSAVSQPLHGAQGWLSRAVPRPNRLFTGRDDVLDRLHAALGESSAALVSDPQAITGLGGMGKTQTALAYVYRRWREYTRVFWLTADTVEALEDGLVSMADEIGLLPAASADRSQALTAAHAWFAGESGWLLVLDNADDIDALAPKFPRHLTGRLLITTRAQRPVKWASAIPLRKFGAEDGALLLLRRAGLLDVRHALADAPSALTDVAKDLSRELDGLPLAIDQAGAFLAESGFSIESYLRRFRSEGLRLLDSSAEPEHASVSVTFGLALRQMTDHTLYGGPAAEAARLCAFLSPDDIPESVLSIFVQSIGRPEREDQAAPPEAVFAALTRFSLLSRNVVHGTFTMHRLVQAVIREQLADDETRAWRERAVNAVSAASPDFEYEQWGLCDQLLPQWRLCAQIIREDGIATPEAGYLLHQLGRYLRARAQYREAEIHCRAALAIAEAVFAPDHRVVADYADELACLCRTLEQYDEAERLHLRAVHILERLAGADDVLLTSKLHNMALLYYQVEEYGKSEGAFLRALAIHARQAVPDRFVLAATMTQLAGIYRIQGQYEQAEEYCKAALITYGEILEPDNVELATANNNLALLYLTTDRLDEAESYYQRALAINDNARGRQHPETAHVLWGLARVRWLQNRPHEADALFREAIEIDRSQLGPTHSRTMRIVDSYEEFKRSPLALA